VPDPFLRCFILIVAISLLPIAIEGTSRALPKRGFVLQGRHPIRVTILDPLPYAAFANDEVDALTLRVRGLIARAIDEKDAPPAAA